MKQLKTYGLPSLIIVAVALLVCLMLWGIYQSNPSAASETPATASEASPEFSQERMPDLGVFMPVLGFVMNGIKQTLFMGIPGLITWQVLQMTRRNKKAHA